MKLFIDTEKSLQYSDELGWNWHKSWNLPNISVRLEVMSVIIYVLVDKRCLIGRFTVVPKKCVRLIVCGEGCFGKPIELLFG